MQKVYVQNKDGEPLMPCKSVNYIYSSLIFGITAFILIILHLILTVPTSEDITIIRTFCDNDFCENIEVTELRFYVETIVDSDNNPKTINCSKEGQCHYEKRLRQTFNKEDIDDVLLFNQCECMYQCSASNNINQRMEDCSYCNRYKCGDYTILKN